MINSHRFPGPWLVLPKFLDWLGGICIKVLDLVGGLCQLSPIPTFNGLNRHCTGPSLNFLLGRQTRSLGKNCHLRDGLRMMMILKLVISYNWMNLIKLILYLEIRNRIIIDCGKYTLYIESYFWTIQNYKNVCFLLHWLSKHVCKFVNLLSTIIIGTIVSQCTHNICHSLVAWIAKIK